MKLRFKFAVAFMLAVSCTAALQAADEAKPAAAKGVYVRTVAISSTMGPGVAIDTTPYR